MRKQMTMLALAVAMTNGMRNAGFAYRSMGNSPMYSPTRSQRIKK